MAAGLRNPGVRAALASALLFGAGTPLAKLLLGSVNPWVMAGLLYCGSGLGLSLYRLVRRAPRVRIARADLAPLAGAVLTGGVLGPLLLMVGLSAMPASGASLLLNAEAVFTAGLAWVVFREHVDGRLLLGMVAIVAGAVVLSVPSDAALGSPWPALAILGACLAWGIDNNLTRKVALNDAVWLAAVKGSVAGPVNLALGLAAGASLPAVGSVAASMLLGCVAYGVSLALFIVGMRQVGTARAGAYYSIAPFFGTLLALALGEPLTWSVGIAATLMAIGVWLHLSERHDHAHRHEAVTHDHWHVHDEHHQHAHAEGGPPTSSPGQGHPHEHTHEGILHAHQHYPDSHHRHGHPSGDEGPGT